MTSSLTICVVLAIGAIGAVDPRALMERALDEPGKISLHDVRLADALDAISQQTGVKVVMPPDVMALTPYGPDTVIDEVEIAQMPLRQGLAAILSPLGMTFAVRTDHVEVVAKSPLRYLARPPTWEELSVLTDLAAMQPGLDGDALASLQARLQFHVPDPDPWSILSTALRSVGAGPGDEVLAVACEHSGWAWFPSGQQIIVTTREGLIRRLLARPISIRLRNRRVVEVLQALGERANISIRTEPGATGSLPPPLRQVSVVYHEKPLEDVLDAIASHTGMGYLIDRDGVLFYGPGATSGTPRFAPSPTRGPTSTDPYVAKLVTPLDDGRTVEWLIRRSELPEDLRKMRDTDLQRAFEQLRRRSDRKLP